MHTGRFAVEVVRFLVVALLVSSACVAQLRTSRLAGRVCASGHPVAGVRVSLSPQNFRKPVAETTTAEDGSFSFIGLSCGSYTLDARDAGWKSAYIDDVELRSESTVSISISLYPAPDTRRSTSPQILYEDIWWGTQFKQLSTQDLPNTRNIWSLLEPQEPSTVTDRLDIGGLETGTPALFGALGASWTENRYSLNGLDVTDPYIPGFPLVDPNLDDLTEFQVVTAAKPAQFENSGVNLSLATPRPPDNSHGAARVFYSGRALESDNMNARLARFNFPGPERMNHLLDVSAQLGGKLPSAFARLPFYVSLSTQHLSKDQGGFPAPMDARIYRGLVEFTPFSNSSQSLNLLYSGQHIVNSRENASQFVSPNSTTRGNRNFHQFQGHWDKAVSRSTLFSARFGVLNAIISSAIQSSVTGVATLDLPELRFTGAAPLSLSGVRTRYQGQGLLQTIRQSPAGTHSLSLGVEWSRSDISNTWSAPAGIQQILVNGLGAEVIRWNTPTEARQHVQNVAEFVQDSWRPARWISLPFGLRLDTSTGHAAGSSAGISWTTVQPRAGFVIPLSLRGLVLRGNWARYGHVLQGRYLDFGNPAALGGQVFRWNDLNQDRMLQPSEIGNLVRVFGGPYSGISRSLSRPFTDEISFGLEENWGKRLSVAVRFFRRDDHRLLAISNIGVPLSDYRPVQVLDPGDDGVLGTSDDRIIRLFNQNPSSLGHDFLVLSNSGLHASYRGLEIRLIKPLLHNWEFSASFTAGQTLATTSPGNSVFQDDTGFVGALGTDPNTFVNAQGRTHFDRAFTGKVTAYYSAPFGFHLGAVASYYDGVPFGRLLFVNGFNQGPFFVRATPVGHPGGFQTQLNSTFDLRLARDFVVGRGTVSAYLDVFNVLNANSNTLESDLTGPAFLSRVPLAVEAPRTARLGVAWKF